MAYKRKRAKARRTPARKRQKGVETAAAAAAAAELLPASDADKGAAVQQCDAGFSSRLSRGGMGISCAPVVINDGCSHADAELPIEVNMGAAHGKMTSQENKIETQQQQQSTTRGCQRFSATPSLLYSDRPTPTDLACLSVASSAAGLPCILAATHLPCILSGTPYRPPCGEDGGGESDYIAYLLSEHRSNETTRPMTMWGVYSLRNGDCLQVIHWHHSPAAVASPSTNGDLHPSSSLLNEQRARELIMRVDATGLCFMLAPSSLVSVEGGGAAGCMTPASVSSEPDEDSAPAAAPGDVYWLIPSVMKESFLALLQAQEWLRTTSGRHQASEACSRSFECQGWCVRPHSTRWVSVTSPGEATASAVERCELHTSPAPPTAALPAPKRKTKKGKRQHGSLSLRAQPQQPSSVAAAAPLQNTESTTRFRLAVNAAMPSSPSQYRIPYVAAVQQPQKGLGSATESHLPLAALPAAAVAPVVLLLGNRIAPYPSDSTCATRM
ncbi:hypothetical protein, unknown function [Leishmania tarentolae]|uniref:Uncharacterized protein n=1 Tax=Leishmania tarentolae TaxID=5689 RepID=A0A640KAN9_LEITA|nr:hypothetical protein, unknown function [Leishmania tarentolae]